jgi:hypothetical protein
MRIQLGNKYPNEFLVTARGDIFRADDITIIESLTSEIKYYLEIGYLIEVKDNDTNFKTHEVEDKDKISETKVEDTIINTKIETKNNQPKEEGKLDYN